MPVVFSSFSRTTSVPVESMSIGPTSSLPFMSPPRVLSETSFVIRSSCTSLLTVVSLDGPAVRDGDRAAPMGAGHPAGDVPDARCRPRELSSTPATFGDVEAGAWLERDQQGATGSSGAAWRAGCQALETPRSTVSRLPGPLHLEHRLPGQLLRLGVVVPVGVHLELRGDVRAVLAGDGDLAARRRRAAPSRRRRPDACWSWSLQLRPGCRGPRA